MGIPYSKKGEGVCHDGMKNWEGLMGIYR